MNCREFEDYLQGCVERREPACVEACGEHLQQCPACRELWAEHAALERAIQVWRVEQDVPDLTDRVLAGLQPAPSLSQAESRQGAAERPSRWPAVAAVSVAAAVLVAVLWSGWQGLESLPDAGPGSVAGTDQDPSGEVETVPVSHEANSEVLFGEARMAMASLLGRTSEPFAGVMQFVPSFPATSNRPEADAPGGASGRVSEDGGPTDSGPLP